MGIDELEPEPEARSHPTTESPKAFSLPNLQDGASVPIDAVELAGVSQAPIELERPAVPGSSHPVGRTLLCTVRLLLMRHPHSGPILIGPYPPSPFSTLDIDSADTTNHADSRH